MSNYTILKRTETKVRKNDVIYDVYRDLEGNPYIFHPTMHVMAFPIAAGTMQPGEFICPFVATNVKWGCEELLLTHRNWSHLAIDDVSRLNGLLRKAEQERHELELLSVLGVGTTNVMDYTGVTCSTFTHNLASQEHMVVTANISTDRDFTIRLRNRGTFDSPKWMYDSQGAPDTAVMFELEQRRPFIFPYLRNHNRLAVRYEPFPSNTIVFYLREQEADHE